MGTDSEAAVDRRRAVFEQRSSARRLLGLEVGVVLLGRQRRSLQVRDRLVEDGVVGGDGEVSLCDVGQPQPVVGDVGADAATGRRMPPVLHIALDELMRCRAEQVLTGELATRNDQRDHVLQLVAESVRSASLVEGRSRPQPAGEGLVDEPAVQHDVHGAVRGPHLDGRLDVVPQLLDLAKRGGVVAARARRMRSIAAWRVGLAERHDDLGPIPGGELEARLQRGTWVNARSDGFLQSVTTGEACRPLGRAVATEELGPVSGERGLSPPQIQEGDATAELDVPRVGRQQRLGLRLALW